MVLPELIPWYLQYKRELPWRETHDPYLIWLSEVIMQQTRVEQGLPYYNRFVEKYPTVQKLASADKNDVMKLWQGLGYYNRAENMLKTAQAIVSDHHGIFPPVYDGLILLKGIGPYTAAAIASFAFNEPKAVVDGNVYRVLSRLFAIDTPINSTEGKKIFSSVANEVLDKKNPGLHNQAMMELGAMICKPRQPICQECPVKLKCTAYSEKKVNDFPVKLKKNKPRDRYLNYFFILHHDNTYIRKREEKGIWKNLYEPPFSESIKAIEEDELMKEISILRTPLLPLPANPPKLAYSTKHQLSHQTIYANFWIIKTKKNILTETKTYVSVPLADIHLYPVHRLFDKFLNYYTLHSESE